MLPAERLEKIVWAQLDKGRDVDKVFQHLHDTASKGKSLQGGQFTITVEMVVALRIRVDQAMKSDRQKRIAEEPLAKNRKTDAQVSVSDGRDVTMKVVDTGTETAAKSVASSKTLEVTETTQDRVANPPKSLEVTQTAQEIQAAQAAVMSNLHKLEEARRQQDLHLKDLKERRFKDLLGEMDEQMRTWCRSLAERKQIGTPWRNVGTAKLKVMSAPDLKAKACEGRWIPVGDTFGVDDVCDVEGRRWLRLAQHRPSDASCGWVSTTSRKANREGEVVAAQVDSFEDSPGEDAFQLCEKEDRREAFLRMVHRKSEADLRVPEGLKAELMPYQVEGFEWLVSLFNNDLAGLLADEMGLGKTIQTLALVAFLRETKKRYGPHLVICPKSVVSNWAKEIARFFPEYEKHTVVFQGSPAEREDLAKRIRKVAKKDRPKLIVVTNYEQVHPDRNQVLTDTTWELIIVDEGHRMKNQKSVFHQMMKERFRSRMKLLLTGTPLQNNLDELFALLHYLLPEIFTSASSFKSWFAAPHLQHLESMGLSEYSLQFTEEEEQVLISNMHAMLAPFLLQRTKAGVLSLDALPPRREETLWVPLSAWQESTYEQLKTRTLKRLAADSGEVSHQVLQNVTMHLRKIALHPYLFGRGGDQRLPEDLVRASGKLEALDRLLRKFARFEHKVLIFSQFTSMLDLLQELMTLRSWTFERIDGQVSAEERRARIERFSDKGGAFVFLLSSRAGAVGLNLQAADTVILFDLDWNPQQDKQAIARAHRFGQTKKVLVLRLLTPTPIEQHMERKIEEKLDLEKKFIGAGAFNRAGSAKSPEERASQLRELFGQSGAGGSTQVRKSVTTFSDSNERVSRSLEERTAFEAEDAALGVSGAVGTTVEATLVQAKRLMGPGEAPEAFEAEEESEDSE